MLRSERAVEINVAIMRTFVKLRQILASDQALARKVAEHDRQIVALIEAVQHYLAPPEPGEKRRIGFL